MSPVGTKHTFVESMNNKWSGKMVVRSGRNGSKVLGPNLDDVHRGKLQLDEFDLRAFRADF